MSQQITQDQAISVLVQAVKIAQAKGAYSLEDAALIVNAIHVLAPQAPDAPQTVAEAAKSAAETVDEPKAEQAQG